MKISFLVQCKQDSYGNYTVVCHGDYFKNLTVSADSFDEALEGIRFVLEKFMATTGAGWIEKWKSSPEYVNCPQGCIELPGDIWKCKITREDCWLQAQVLINDKKQFLKCCQAPEVRKEQIFQTITSGRYRGFHHISGRLLCVQCENDKWKKRNQHYHYPWEFVSVSDCIDFSGEFEPEELEVDDFSDDKESVAFEKQLEDEGYLTLGEMFENEGFTSSASGCGVCSECCKRIISAVFPEISDQIRVIDIDFYQR